jgi:PAS domain-containing protein
MIQNADGAGGGFWGNSYDSLPAYVFVERQGRIVYANLAARQVLGAQPEEAFDWSTGEILGNLLRALREMRG